MSVFSLDLNLENNKLQKILLVAFMFNLKKIVFSSELLWLRLVW